jgi:hypothetical protein
LSRNRSLPVFDSPVQATFACPSSAVARPASRQSSAAIAGRPPGARARRQSALPSPGRGVPPGMSRESRWHRWQGSFRIHGPRFGPRDLGRLTQLLWRYRRCGNPAADCKSAIPGSNPGGASFKHFRFQAVAEDHHDLGMANVVECAVAYVQAKRLEWMSTERLAHVSGGIVRLPFGLPWHAGKRATEEGKLNSGCERPASFYRTAAASIAPPFPRERSFKQKPGF